jgi:type IV pilus assembly protein PilE
MRQVGRRAGFTLIELLIALAIVGILVAIAYPSYREHVYKTHRADAKIALLEIAQRQERFYTQYNAYTAVLVSPDPCTGAACGLRYSATSPDEHYTLALSVPEGGGTFSATATPSTTSIQASDAKCTSFTLSSTGAKQATGADSGACW